MSGPRNTKPDIAQKAHETCTCPVLVVNNKLELIGKGGERRLTESVLS